MEAYIVVKKSPCKTEIGTVDLRFNEAVFTTENLANDYIKKRKALKDRDDKGCTFAVEPWHVQDNLDPYKI